MNKQIKIKLVKYKIKLIKQEIKFINNYNIFKIQFYNIETKNNITFTE